MPRRPGGSIQSFAAVLFTITAIAAVAWRTQIPTKGIPPVAVSTVPSWEDYATGGVRVGPEAPPVTIVAFFDYTCPICEVATPFLASLSGRYQNKVALVFRYVTESGPLSVESAIAAYCAESQGEFSAIHKALVLNRKTLGTKQWPLIAAEAGISNTSTFLHCLNGKEAREKVRDDSLSVDRLKVEAVPTFLINQMRVDGFHGELAMDSLIRLAIEG